jgi:voltage-gated potassium channel
MNLTSLKWTLQEIYTEQRYQDPEHTPRLKISLDKFMLILAGFSICLFIYESIENQLVGWVDAMSKALDLVFLADYSLRLYFSGNQRSRKWKDGFAWKNYVIRWYGVIDFIAVFPPLISHFLHIGASVEEYARLSRAFRIIRMTRMLRALRSLRLIRESERVQASLRKFHGKVSRELGFALTLVVSVMFFGSLGIYYIEGSTNEAFHSVGNSLYWSILSLLGQGDGNAFRTDTSKVIAVLVIFSGITFIGIITGSITSLFMDKIGSIMKGKEVFRGEGHVVICGWNSKVLELLLRLARAEDVKEVVVLFDRGRQEEDFGSEEQYRKLKTGEQTRIIWVKGNPRESDYLHNANAERAKSIFIMSDNTGGLENEEDIDARSLMTFNILQEHIERHATKGATTPKITMELLSAPSVRVARRLAVNHIVYADELICGFMTLGACTKDSGLIYEKLMDPCDHQIVTMPLGLLESHSSVGDIGQQLLNQNKILIGMQFSGRFILTALHRNRNLAMMLDDAGLTESAECILKEQFNVKTELKRFIEQSDDTPIDNVLTTLSSFTVLNPYSREVLCSDLLAKIGDPMKDCELIIIR